MAEVENSLLYILLCKPGIDVCKLLTLQHACLPDFYKAYTSVEEKGFIQKDTEGKVCFYFLPTNIQAIHHRRRTQATSSASVKRATVWDLL